MIYISIGNKQIILLKHIKVIPGKCDFPADIVWEAVKILLHRVFLDKESSEVMFGIENIGVMFKLCSENNGTQTMGVFTASYVQLLFSLVGVPLFGITPHFKHPGAWKARHIEIDLENKQSNKN